MAAALAFTASVVSHIEAGALVLFCQTRPGDEVQWRLQQEFDGFSIATTGPRDLLSLAAEGR